MKKVTKFLSLALVLGMMSSSCGCFAESTSSQRGSSALPATSPAPAKPAKTPAPAKQYGWQQTLRATKNDGQQIVAGGDLYLSKSLCEADAAPMRKFHKLQKEKAHSEGKLPLFKSYELSCDRITFTRSK